MSKKLKCLENTDFCLNKIKGENGLLNYIKRAIDNKFTTSTLNYGFYWKKHEKNIIKKRFKIHIENTKTENKTTSIILNIYHYPRNEINFTKNKVCLRLELITPISILKDDKQYYFFETSKILNVNRGPCGINLKNEKSYLEGAYIVHIADKINRIFRVKSSELFDISYLTMCEKDISLKIIKLLQYGKTWYERIAEFKLIDQKIYELTEKVRNIKLSTLFNIITDESLHTLGEHHLNYSSEIKELNKLLLTINLTNDNTFGQIFEKVFNQNSKLLDCEKIRIWDIIFPTFKPYRRTVIKNTLSDISKKKYDDEKLKNFKNFKTIMDWEKKVFLIGSESFKNYTYEKIFPTIAIKNNQKIWK